MVLEHDSESSESSEDTESSSQGNNKKKPGKKTSLSTRINILADSGGTRYDLNNGRLRNTGGNTTFQQRHPDLGLEASQNLRQQEPVVSLGGYHYTLMPAPNYPGGAPSPITQSPSRQGDDDEQDVLLVPVTQEIADMLAHAREDRIDQLICEILEKQIGQQERQLLGPRVLQEQPADQPYSASVSVNITRPPLPQQMGQSAPQQSIQPAQVGTPIRVQLGQQEQQQTFQQILQPQQQQIIFSVGPQGSAMIPPEINGPVTAEPLHSTFEVAGQMVAQQVVLQPMFTPTGHPMVQQPGPPVPQFFVQPCCQRLGQIMPQPVSEPVIQSVAQQASQYIYEPINQYVAQPAPQFMNQAIAQQQIGGLAFQPMRQPVFEPVDTAPCAQMDATTFCVGHIVTSVSHERMPVGPQQMQQGPLIGQQMVETLQVNDGAMPLYSLAQQLTGCQITQPMGQQPNMNMAQDTFFIGPGIQEQLFHDYLVEPKKKKKKKKKSKKDKSKAEMKESPPVSPMPERYLQEESIRIEFFNGLPQPKLCTLSLTDVGERPEPPSPDDDLQYRRSSSTPKPKRKSEPVPASCTCRPAAPDTPPKQCIREMQPSPPNMTAPRTDDLGGQLMNRRLSQSPGQQGNELNKLRQSKVLAQPLTKGRRVSQAPTPQNENGMLCQGCKLASVQVPGNDTKYLDKQSRKTSVAKARRTSQREGRQDNDIGNQKEAQNIGPYGGVFGEGNKEDSVENDALPAEVGRGSGRVPEAPFAQAPEAMPVSPPQPQPGPPGQAPQPPAALPPDMNGNAATGSKAQDNSHMPPAWVLIGGAVFAFILIAVISFVLYDVTSKGKKRRDTIEMLHTELVPPNSTHRPDEHLWRHHHLKRPSRRRHKSPPDHLWNS
ncbi:uncharacterized protein LOC135399656 [Ornithodoros turicata]|uniref:uncharacterized protein LOC135399656 n=1 Tax=Ornithodoros turicata TaxID=34597 RepID=UPI00313952D9